MRRCSTEKSSAKSRCILASQSGAAMVFVLVIAVIGSIVMASVFFTSRYTIKKSGVRRERVGALNIAEAGKESFYAKLLNDQNFTLTPNSSVMVFNDQIFGNGMFSVRCITSANIDTCTVQAWGNEGPNCVKLEIRAAVAPSLKFNVAANIGGAITSRYDVDLTGNISIDGRDYDANNNLVGNGVYGVQTCMNMVLKGSGEVGGNGEAPVDKKDIDDVRSTVCSERVPITPVFASPEAFLGVPAGSLDEYKVPALNPPFNGIVYIDGDCGPVHFGNSSGILIVHNSTSTAQLHVNQGTFKGLIICDVMDKINGQCDILGAVVSLGRVTKSIFGTGNGTLHYSSEVLNNLAENCENIKKKISELSWKEMSCQ